MAPSRLIFTAIGALWALGTVSLHATGGDYDEVPLALDYYLERIPAKSVSQIYAENGYTTSTAKPITLPREQLVHDFARGPSPKLVAEIDRLLVESRSPYAGPDQVNLLQDLRDLAANTQATGLEMSAYVQWRLAHLDAFKKAQLDQDDNAPKTASASLADIDAKGQAASKAMLPHWLYLEGAFLYLGGDDTKSEPFFDRVLNEFPDSGRAEPALFMKGRCRLSQAVAAGDDGVGGDPVKRDAAKALFQSYLTKYPQGRYTSDVLGWLGGAAYRSTDPATALDFYTRQLEMKDHPENFGSALVMLEKVLARQKPDNEATLDLVAQHPPVALALAYFALNFTQPKEEDDQDYQAFNTWRHGVLPKLGQAVLKHKDLYQGAAWQDRYLAILAQAASDHGDQKQALDLIGMGGKSGPASDDYLFAKALVLQRAKQLADAEKAYRELLANFPASPLAAGAGYRLALTLHDQKRDGEALLELAALRGNHLTLRNAPGVTPAPQPDDDLPPPTESSALGIDYSGAPDEEVAETMDAILNFAPLPELEKALKLATGKDQAELRNDLGQILQERYLDHDDFRNAARFTHLPQAQKKWTDLAAKSDALENATGPEAAKGAMEMADFWVANRVMLPALPLDSLDARATLDFRVDAATHRAANAALLAYTQPEVELESREGLWHAIKWWSKASATHDPVAAPTALWSIIKSRRTIAEVNPYTWSRALAGEAGSDTKADYTALLAKYPDSPEAKHVAVYWTFAKDAPQSFYERFSVGFDRDNLAADWLKAMGLPDNAYDWQGEQWTQKQLAGLVAEAATDDSKTFAEKTSTMRDQVAFNATSIEEADSMNCLNDLVQFSQVESIPPATRVMYVKARYQLVYGLTNAAGAAEPAVDLAALRQSPGASDIADFIDFLDIARTAGNEVEVPVKDLDKDGQPLTFTSRDYQGLLKKTTAFLANHPKSVKREAARLLQIRALVRLSRPREVPWTLDWPAVNQWDDAYTPRFLTLAPFDAKATNAAFRAYDAEFPHGQYTNAVLALHADAELIQQHWDNALDNLLALLDQQTAPELHNGAAGELAYIFDQLDKDDRREAVLTEILKRPAARKDLASYIATGGLPLLADYLNAKLATAK